MSSFSYICWQKTLSPGPYVPCFWAKTADFDLCLQLCCWNLTQSRKRWVSTHTQNFSFLCYHYPTFVGKKPPFLAQNGRFRCFRGAVTVRQAHLAVVCADLIVWLVYQWIRHICGKFCEDWTTSSAPMGQNAIFTEAEIGSGNSGINSRPKKYLGLQLCCWNLIQSRKRWVSTYTQSFSFLCHHYPTFVGKKLPFWHKTADFGVFRALWRYGREI